MKKNLISALVACSLASYAWAFEPFTVRDIRVEGIQRTEAGTIFSYLPVKVGEQLTNEKAAESIRVLFGTGFFRDVRIEVEKDVMVVLVQERPAISSIDFVGMKEFDREVILKALKSVGIANGRIFDRAQMERAEQELKRQYLTKGKYSVRITTTVTPQERNRVGLNFTIEEGSAARIRSISFVGNKDFADKELLENFSLTTPGWLTWYTKSDQYSRQKLAADLEKLKSFYMDQGYLEFNVNSTQVSISPDKQDVFITVNVNEGARYQISSVRLSGDIPIDDEELKTLVRIKAGDIYSRKALNETTRALNERLGKVGYAFSNVNAAPEIDKEKNKVAFTIFVDPGKRVYVRRVNISGNTRTRDEVIRRELRQMESAWYDADKIKASKVRVDRLGYFTESSIETPAVAGTSDQVDVNLKVKEKPTGNLMFGVGTSNIDRVILSASLAQDNFLGSGNMVSFEINSAKSYRTYAFSYTNPYFTVDGVSQGFDVYHRTIDTTQTTNTSLADYKTSSTGAGIRFGFPLGEKENISFGIGVDSTTINTFANSPQFYKDFVRDSGSTNFTIPLTLSWTSDGKNSYFFPTEGTYQRAAVELAIPGADLSYYRASYQWQRFFPLNKRFTLMLNGEVAYADGLGSDDLPFYKNYYAGGIGSVRGYETSSLGPKVPDGYGDYYSVGGNAKVIANAEVFWALPGMEDSVRLGVFFDIGQVYADKYKQYDHSYSSSPRYSMGVSAAWISPVGPLKISVGTPLNKKPGDRTEAFQFQLGSIF